MLALLVFDEEREPVIYIMEWYFDSKVRLSPSEKFVLFASMKAF